MPSMSPRIYTVYIAVNVNAFIVAVALLALGVCLARRIYHHLEWFAVHAQHAERRDIIRVTGGLAATCLLLAATANLVNNTIPVGIAWTLVALGLPTYIAWMARVSLKQRGNLDYLRPARLRQVCAGNRRQALDELNAEL